MRQNWAPTVGTRRRSAVGQSVIARKIVLGRAKTGKNGAIVWATHPPQCAPNEREPAFSYFSTLHFFQAIYFFLLNQQQV